MIDETLTDRGATHGRSYVERARLSQNLKRTMRSSANWPTLPADVRESLEMIQMKISRICCGDPEFQDHWHDIIGYAKLIEDRLGEAGQA